MKVDWTELESKGGLIVYRSQFNCDAPIRATQGGNVNAGPWRWRQKQLRDLASNRQ